MSSNGAPLLSMPRDRFELECRAALLAFAHDRGTVDPHLNGMWKAQGGLLPKIPGTRWDAHTPMPTYLAAGALEATNLLAYKPDSTVELAAMALRCGLGMDLFQPPPPTWTLASLQDWLRIVLCVDPLVQHMTGLAVGEELRRALWGTQYMGRQRLLYHLLLQRELLLGRFFQMDPDHQVYWDQTCATFYTPDSSWDGRHAVLDGLQFDMSLTLGLPVWHRHIFPGLDYQLVRQLS